jgi:hypothetical protein
MSDVPSASTPVEKELLRIRTTRSNKCGDGPLVELVHGLEVPASRDQPAARTYTRSPAHIALSLRMTSSTTSRLAFAII